MPESALCDNYGLQSLPSCSVVCPAVLILREKAHQYTGKCMYILETTPSRFTTTDKKRSSEVIRRARNGTRTCYEEVGAKH